MARSVPLSRVLGDVSLGLVYFALAAASIAYTRFDGGPAFVWVATALLFARLSLLPLGRWPLPMLLCWVGSFVASGLFGVGFACGAPLAVILVLEAAAAAWLLLRWLGGSAYYESPKGVAAFAIVAGVIVPAISATAATVLISTVKGTPVQGTWIAWFAAHGLGTAVVAPMFVLAMRGEFRGWLRWASGWRRTEAIVMVALVAVVVAGVFMQSRVPLLFVPSLPIMVATLRLGRAGAAISIVLLAAIGGAYTMQGIGPITLVPGNEGLRIQFFQIYLAATTLLVLPVAALIREYREVLRRLSESEVRYRLIAERSADAILSIATDGTILYASPAVFPLAGYEPGDLIGRNIVELVHPEDLDAVRAARAGALAEPAAMSTVEYRAPIAAGTYRWFETSMRAVIDARGQTTGTMSAIRDVTDRKATEARLSAAANTDALTGLPNRRAFTLALEARLRSVREEGLGASLALFDIDWFKAVNDRHGHAAGDAVLVAFAQRARRALRDGDCLARIGGEEFGLVLSVSGAEEAERVCERLRRTLSDTPVPVDGTKSVRITVSAGVAPLRAEDDTSGAMRAADAALYSAKANGRDRLVLAA